MELETHNEPYVSNVVAKAPTTHVSPDQMADMYWKRLHYGALNAAVEILKEYPVKCATNVYWKSVLRNLRAKVAEVNLKRRPSGNA